MLKLYGRYFGIQFRCVMQYKASFFMMLLGQFLMAFSGFLSVYFLFTRFHQVEGFTLGEVLLCFATVMMAFSLSECFVRGFDEFSSMISNGEFDRMVVRPRGLVFQVLASRIEFTRIGKLIQALLVLLYAIPTSGVEWTPARVGVLLLMIAGGTVVFSGLLILYAALCFFTTQGLEFINIFTDGGREFGSYPFVLYGKGILMFFTFVVPLALVQYYPLLYLLGRAPHDWYGLLTLCSALFLIPCALLWRVGLRHYKSTGS